MYVHDAITHSRLSELLDMAEDAILARGFCAPDEVESHMFKAYLRSVDANMSYCSQYLVTEEQCAGRSFIIDLCQKLGEPKFMRHAYKMAEQLINQPHFYFRHYEQMLTAEYLELLERAEDLDRLRFSGVILLAVASLPGVRSDIRRILRRRGVDGGERFIPTLVADETMTQRIHAMKGIPPAGDGNKKS